MTVKFQILKDKVLFLAIALSLGWHILWLTAIRVVFIQDDTAPVKFSKVSFLGPIAGRSTLQATFGRSDRSFLEKRYVSKIGAVKIPEEPKRGIYPDASSGPMAEWEDPVMKQLVRQTLLTTKQEPAYYYGSE